MDCRLQTQAESSSIVASSSESINVASMTRGLHVTEHLHATPTRYIPTRWNTMEALIIHLRARLDSMPPTHVGITSDNADHNARVCTRIAALFAPASQDHKPTPNSIGHCFEVVNVDAFAELHVSSAEEQPDTGEDSGYGSDMSSSSMPAL
ncbi:hypothetical protein NM688_g513 [Phlebia brevispora]|uniref:Uncharacterized protein n=1 Tax=Phlebia brevispora TaxID=194682 RepID=A0ACC1TE56_9APHY|nr:hypothetical protein NM688_g513 [Phlebia brevispora]